MASEAAAARKANAKAAAAAAAMSPPESPPCGPAEPSSQTDPMAVRMPTEADFDVRQYGCTTGGQKERQLFFVGPSPRLSFFKIPLETNCRITNKCWRKKSPEKVGPLGLTSVDFPPDEQKSTASGSDENPFSKLRDQACPGDEEGMESSQIDNPFARRSQGTGHLSDVADMLGGPGTS